MASTTILADDYPTVYYKIAFIYLKSEAQIADSLERGVSVLRDRDREMPDLIHMYRENNIGWSAISRNTGLPVSQCKSLVNTTLDKGAHQKVVSILTTFEYKS
jgi:hypothetical protein